MKPAFAHRIAYLGCAAALAVASTGFAAVAHAAAGASASEPAYGPELEGFDYPAPVSTAVWPIAVTVTPWAWCALVKLAPCSSMRRRPPGPNWSR